jgi:hypothetical protein
MKKIVGILAAAAVLATSVFAADVSAGVRLEGSLFNWDGKNVSALNLKHNNQYYHAPIAFSVSGDKAGGQLKLTDQARGNATATEKATGDAEVKSSAWQIWIKPVDMLKLTFGCYKNTLNQEQIGWWRSQSSIGDDGGSKGNWVATLTPADGVSIDLLAANEFGKAWFNGADNSLAEFGLIFKYSADFGTIGALFDANDTFKDLKFGASFAGSADALSYFVNVLGFYKTTFNKVRAELYAAYSQDGLGLKFFVPADINVNNTNDVMAMLDIGAVFRLDYAIDNGTLFVEIEDGDFLKNDFGMSIYPGIKTNVGACAIELGVKLGASSNFTVDVPVSFQVAF